MKIVSTITLACMLLAAPPGTVGASGRESAADSASSGRVGAYVQIGAHIGSETSDLASYPEAHYRIFFECGLKWTRPHVPGRRLEDFLLGPSLAGAIETPDQDLRIGFGPTAVWRLGERWRLHTMAGIAVSNRTEGFRPGAQLRGSLVYRNFIAIDCLCYIVPVGNDTEGIAASLYGGVTLHGATGAWLSIGAALLYGVAGLVAVLLVGASAGGLSG